MREYVSDYIGLPLLTRGGERIGYVKNVQTDKNLTRVRNLECCGEDEEEFALPLSAAATFGEGAIVVKSPAAKGCKNCLPAPFGMEAFSTEGAPLVRIEVDDGVVGIKNQIIVPHCFPLSRPGRSAPKSRRGVFSSGGCACSLFIPDSPAAFWPGWGGAACAALWLRSAAPAPG